MGAAVDKPGSDHHPKRITMDSTASAVVEMAIADFVTRSSRRLFEVLNIESGFLLVDPDDWESRPDYRAATELV